MPGTLWSAPAQNPNTASLTTSSFVTSTALNDISPSQVLIGASQLNPGTRIRLYASGSYTATTTASSVAWGFYLSQQATGLVLASSAALAVSASTAVAVATAWPFIMSYSGVVNAASVQQNATTGKITGQGWVLLPFSLTGWQNTSSPYTFSMLPMPVTAALRTAAQSATVTGLNTETPLIASLGVTVAVNTGLSSITVDELTCELIG
jgi:hypothetical protein